MSNGMQYSPYDTPPMPQQRSGGPVKILLIIFGIIALILLLCCGGLTVFVMSVYEDREIKEEELACLVTVADLKPYGLSVEQSEAHETTSYGDVLGEITMQYVYATDEFIAWPIDGVYVETMVERCSDNSSARSTYDLNVFLKNDYLEPDFVLEEQPELCTLGDQCYAGVLISEETGEPDGNLVIVQDGRFVFTYLFTGAALTTQEEVEGLLGPKMEKAKQLSYD